MEAIVLAGGFGTRLKTVVPDLPKPMAPVAGRPFLEILLTALSRKGITRVILSLGHMAEKIVSHFGDRYEGMQIVYEIEQMPLGTGGAIRQAMAHCCEDHVFIFNGDTFLDLEIAQVEEQWKKNQTPIIVAREVPDTARFGRLETAQGQVTGFAEKGATGQGFINAGCYVFPTHLLESFTHGTSFSIETDFLAKTIAAHPFDLFTTSGLFIDIGVPEDYALAQTLFEQQASN